MIADNDRSMKVEVPEDVHTVFCFWEKRHLKGKGDYIRVFQDVLLEIAKDRELNLTDHRVLLVILTQMEFENYFNLTQSEIGELLGIDRGNISRSLQKLERRGFIVSVSQSGRKKIYLVNPHIAFKTKAKGLIDLEEDWDLYNSEHHRSEPA
jgi:DNA-binding MarR family transcriptional regulator